MEVLLPAWLIGMLLIWGCNILGTFQQAVVFNHNYFLFAFSVLMFIMAFCRSFKKNNLLIKIGLILVNIYYLDMIFELNVLVAVVYALSLAMYAALSLCDNSEERSRA